MNMPKYQVMVWTCMRGGLGRIWRNGFHSEVGWTQEQDSYRSDHSTKSARTQETFEQFSQAHAVILVVAPCRARSRVPSKTGYFMILYFMFFHFWNHALSVSLNLQRILCVLLSILLEFLCSFHKLKKKAGCQETFKFPIGHQENT